MTNINNVQQIKIPINNPSQKKKFINFSEHTILGLNELFIKHVISYTYSIFSVHIIYTVIYVYNIQSFNANDVAFMLHTLKFKINYFHFNEIIYAIKKSTRVLWHGRKENFQSIYKYSRKNKSKFYNAQ